ncbi:MAG: T9SS type A sorting domain-containing protein [Prevotella sp.]|uniref:T9SS type A sorting domain-containing protein n=1 Tax=Prevotella sp. TaxID=59823 RepID=UPI002A2FD000|nr:T9SS type A sorting domain-containing protein [Prevotella sp.]MDD7317400.1 T9SS type A sorting domain-containing protein [Prevotellaceae bacterium]MDY4019498.1 T9SS type A sorting domain-containing protein [Prevotella sp.]
MNFFSAALFTVMTLTSSAVSAADVVMSNDNKTVRRSINLNEDKGILMYGATMKDAEGPLHLVSWRSKFAHQLTNIAEIDPTDNGLHVVRIRCGTEVNGKYYGYLVNGYTFVDLPKSFVTIDFKTGKMTTIADMQDHTNWPTIYEMTYDRERNMVLALAYGTKDYASTDLYAIDITNGSYTLIKELDYYAWALAADYDGNIYVIQGKPDKDNKYYEGSYLVQLDPNEDYNTIKKTELKIDGQGIIPNFQHTMEFDNNSNLLYWLCTDGYGHQKEYVIDIKKNTIKKESDFLQNMVVGLYIPFEGADSRLAAGKVTDLNISVADGTKPTTTINWTNPSVNWRGDALDAFYEVAISRNSRSNVVAHVSGAVGEAKTWTDNSPEQGVVTYYLTSYRKSGEKGLTDSIKIFVGQDVPGNVVNLQANANGSGVNLTWEQPATSHTGKDYDKTTLKYDITRNPGNKVIATDVTATSYNDAAPGFYDKYSYTVTAKNAYGTGESASTTPLFTGKAYEPSFYEDFDNTTQAGRWQTIDNDFSGKSFAYAGGNFDAFKNFRIYMDPHRSVDDYLVSPLIHLEGGKPYRVSIDAILGDSRETHTFAFTYGKEVTSAGQSNVIATHSNVMAAFADDIQNFSDIFTPAADGDYLISVHCTSPSSDYMSYFGVNAFSLERVYNNDLSAINLILPTEVGSGKEAKATVTVKNLGLTPQSNYKAQVIDEDGKVIGETTVNETIAPDATKNVTVPFTTNESGKIILKGNVVLEGDENPQNDLSKGVEADVKTDALDWNVTCKNSDLSQSTSEPMSFMYEYSTIQTVYTKEELGKEDGQIKGIAFSYTPNEISADTEPVKVKVYMGTTTSADIYTDNSGWINNSNLTLVYEGEQTIKSGSAQVMTLPFSVPFSYDHTKNIVVQVWKEGITSEMFPALFDMYAGENWNKLRTLRYQGGGGQFTFTENSYAVAGKPVAYFAIDFTNGIGSVSMNDATPFAFTANGMLITSVELKALTIIDMSGRTVFHHTNVKGSIDTRLQRGVYIVKATGRDGNAYTSKVILGK